MAPRTLVFIPTYNERANVESLASEIQALGLGLDILFMDDNSPDGTGEVLERLSRAHPSLSVIRRSGKLGIGSAHLEALRWAYDRGVSVLITMDGDFTHPPRYIPDFLAAGRGHDVVVGSRHMLRESLKEWNLYRLALTRLGHLLTRWLLGMSYDATGGYRLYRLDRIPRPLFELIRSRGYSFFFESLYLLHLNGLSIAEVPITLPARTYGTSKMRSADILKSLCCLLELCLARWREPGRFKPRAGRSREPRDPSAKEWDKYWQAQAGRRISLYGLIAGLYRRHVIKRNLEHFLGKHFAPGSELLHAGCGGGQVDQDIVGSMRVTALDISEAALALYRRLNGQRCQVLQGSIMAIPSGEASFDGVYNLGVLEHFSEEDIRRILAEFRRVLRPGGKLVVFWPPRYGLSVLVLKLAHFLLNRLLRLGVKLHPDEICLLESRAHAERLLEGAGLSLLECYFGPRDFFVQTVLVARRP